MLLANKEKSMYTVFGIEQCPSCVKAKDLLDRKKIEYSYVSLDDHPEMFENIKKLGLRTVPQVFDSEGKHIGGYEDLYLHLK